MTTFQKVQKYSSIIPFWSTIFVAIITMFELKRRAASRKIWFFFILTLLIAGTAVYLLNKIVMTGLHPLLNIIASGLIFAIANFLFVDFQVMSVNEQRTSPIFSNSKGVILFCILAVIGSFVLLLFVLFSPAVDIKDNNGSENTNLSVIDTNDFIASPDNYSAFSSYTSRIGSRTNVTSKLKDYDYQKCTFRCKKISGIMTLQATQIMNDKIALEITSHVEEGNMEIVIIVDGEYYCHVPINQEESILLSDICGKVVVVKFAAESAKLDVSVERIAM